MTVTYPHDRPLPHDARMEETRPEPYVPVYARTRGSTRGRKGGVKTWMILAPIGVLVLGGVAAAMIAGSGDDAAPAPLAEPAATPPVLSAQPAPAEVAPVMTAPAPVEATPAPAPVVRAAPERRAAPAPVRRAAPAPAPAPAATREAPAEPAGPQPYTSSLNTSPAAPAPAPVIVIQPQS